MNPAVYLAITVFIVDTPWFILCCVPFIPNRKISIKQMAFRIFLVSLTCALTILILGMTLPDKLSNTINFIRLLTYIPMLMVYMRSFDVKLVKMLYVFLLEQGTATMLNLTGFHLCVNVFNLPSMHEGLWQAFITLMCIAVLFPIFWHLFRTVVRTAMATLNARQTAMMCISPGLFVLLGNLYGILTPYMGLEPIYSAIFGLLIIFTGLAANLIAIRSTMDSAQRAKLETELEASRRQLSVEGRRYTEISQNMETARAARHDVRHHLATLTGLLNRNDTEGLESYLKSWRTSLPDEDSTKIWCNNYTIDSLLKHYFLPIKKEGVELDIKLDLLENCPIAPVDLSVLFGNLIENAANAVAKQRSPEKYIRIRSETTDKRMTLVVDNSADDTAPLKEGIGLSSVRAVAKKYDGYAAFTKKNGEFQAAVILQFIEA